MKLLPVLSILLMGASVLPTCFTLMDVVTDKVATTHVRKLLSDRAAEIRKGGDFGWGTDSATKRGKPYEYDFGELLGVHKTFAKLIAHRKASRKSTHLLDLFGSGIGLTDLSAVDSSTGVRLVAPEVPNASNKVHVISGDLFEQEAWNNLSDLMAKQRIASMDIITVRPFGAFVSLETELAGEMKSRRRPEELEAFNQIYINVIRIAYYFLSDDDGEMYAQLPSYGDFTRWVAELNKLPGLKAQLTGSSLRLVRSAGSPSSLPSPWENSNKR